MQYYQQYPSHISMENEDINNLDEDEDNNDEDDSCWRDAIFNEFGYKSTKFKMKKLNTYFLNDKLPQRSDELLPQSSSLSATNSAIDYDGHYANGYEVLTEWPSVQPNPATRDADPEDTNSQFTERIDDKNRAESRDTKPFYDEDSDYDRSESEASSDSDSSDSDSGSDSDSSSENSDSDSATASSSEQDSESESEEGSQESEESEEGKQGK